jgi:hypothetical protein
MRVPSYREEGHGTGHGLSAGASEIAMAMTVAAVKREAEFILDAVI